MKVLAVVGGFLPAKEYGGPVVSINNVATLVQNTDIELYVLTVDHDLKSAKRFESITDGWNQRNNCRVMYLREEQVKYQVLTRITRELMPDVIYLNSLFLAKFTIPFLCIAKTTKIPLLMAPRGDICKGFSGRTKKLIYIQVLKSLLRQNRLFYQATSDEEVEQIIKLIGVDVSRIFFLPNVPDSETINKSDYEKQAGKLRAIFISRIQRKKNLHGALEVLRNCGGQIEYDIYGSKEAPEYWAECEEIINSLPSNISVRYCGQIDHHDVKKTIAGYDLYFVPTFSENYGHAIVEALQASTPVLIGAKTPWADVEEYNAGWAIDVENKVAFRDAIEKMTALDSVAYAEMAAASLKYIQSKTQIAKLKDDYVSMFCKVSSAKL